MNLKGHVAFGAISLVPLLNGNTFSYFNTTDRYLIPINNIIFNFNKHILDWNYLFFSNFSLKNSIELLFLLLIYYIGIRFPDIDLLLKKLNNNHDFAKYRYLYHRQFTHSLFLTFFVVCYFSNSPYVFAFCYGLLSHLIADILTGSIPIFIYGTYYKTANFLLWRIGLDSLYIYTKPKYKEGSTLTQKMIEKIKKNIVTIFDNYSKYIIGIVFLYFIYLKFNL